MKLLPARLGGTYTQTILGFLGLTCLFVSASEPAQLDKELLVSESQSSSPLGEVSLVDPEGKETYVDRVQLWTFGSVYGALGVTKERFEFWEEEYGLDSRGLGTNGDLLAADYPIFSKVAWMYIDQVDLSSKETEELIDECDRAIEHAAEPAAREEFDKIRRLALLAKERSATLRFGHP